MSVIWRPYFPLVFLLHSIYMLYPYIGTKPMSEVILKDFASNNEGAIIVNHSETYDPKTNILYFSFIPFFYLSPNGPERILERPVENLTSEDCWLLKGAEGFVEIQLRHPVKVYNFSYYHFDQNETIADSTPKSMIIETLTSNNTLILGKFDDFANASQTIVIHTNHTVVSNLRIRIVENYGNSIFTSFCRFQLFGELPIIL